MTREQQINAILGRGPEDARRMALNRIDDEARRTNTFGSREHRQERDRAEKKYDDARRALERLTDEQLGEMLGTVDAV